MTRTDIVNAAAQRLNRTGDSDALALLSLGFTQAHRELQLKHPRFRGENCNFNVTFDNLLATWGISVSPTTWTCSIPSILPALANVKEFIHSNVFDVTNPQRVSVGAYSPLEYDKFQRMVDIGQPTEQLYFCPVQEGILFWPFLAQEWVGNSQFYLQMTVHALLPDPSSVTGLTHDYFTDYGFNYLIYRTMREACLDLGYTADFEKRLADRETEALKDFVSNETHYQTGGPKWIPGGRY